MQHTAQDMVPARVWIATALLAAAVATGLVLFFSLGGDVPAILTTVTTEPAP